jgi:hypothetical protein
VVAFPIGVIGLWIAMALAMQAIRVRSQARARREAAARAAEPRPADVAPEDRREVVSAAPPRE